MTSSNTIGQPKLSLVFAGRNDGYGGNFNWRISTALNYLADNLHRLGKLDEVEAVIADWASETPLHAALSLNAAARRIARFISVPAEVARQVQGDSEFPLVLAQNAAIRRARGEYIAQVDSDILFAPELAAALLDILQGRRRLGVPTDRSLIFTKRRHVPWRYISDSPPIHELDWFIRRWGWMLPIDRYMGFEHAGPGFMLMHRSLWDECQGYDERLIYRGWIEIDLGIRIRRQYPLFNLQKIGLTAFHLEHFPARKGKYDPRKWNTPGWNNAFQPNGENWGLAVFSLPEFTFPAEPLSPPADSSSLPAVQVNARLLGHILRVITNWLVYPIRFLVGRLVLLAERSLFHLGVIRGRLAGHPLSQWVPIIRDWWIERKKRY